MKRYLWGLLLLFPMGTFGQQYPEKLQGWRDDYKYSLTTGSHPIKPADTAYVRFFEPDEDYRVKAYFVPITGTRPFMMTTMHGGMSKAVRTYGYVYFNLMGASLRLYVYRFLDMENTPDGIVRLFIPFTDRTNYKETFQGGRYMDLNASEIKNGEVMLDFNKAYNPHTAYEKGYSYLVPPRANSLRIEIRAGEKLYGKDPGY